MHGLQYKLSNCYGDGEPDLLNTLATWWFRDVIDHFIRCVHFCVFFLMFGFLYVLTFSCVYRMDVVFLFPSLDRHR
jgi:hypothetical protein